MSTADWTTLDLPEVRGVAERAAQKVARNWVGIVEYDDLLMEAMLIVVTNRPVVEKYIADKKLGGLFHWLWCDLVTIARKEGLKHQREMSLNALLVGV